MPLGRPLPHAPRRRRSAAVPEPGQRCRRRGPEPRAIRRRQTDGLGVAQEGGRLAQVLPDEPIDLRLPRAERRDDDPRCGELGGVGVVTAVRYASGSPSTARLSKWPAHRATTPCGAPGTACRPCLAERRGQIGEGGRHVLEPGDAPPRVIHDERLRLRQREPVQLLRDRIRSRPWARRTGPALSAAESDRGSAGAPHRPRLGARAPAE